MFNKGAIVVILTIIYVSYKQCNAEEEIVLYKLGAIFDAENPTQQDAAKKAFTAAVNAVNKLDYGFKFEEVTKSIEYDNPYEAMRATCELLEEGVIGIFGPLSEENSNVIQSVCDAKEVPHIEVRWDDHPLNGTIVNVYPHPDILTKTYINLIEAWGWMDFVILYENNESLQRVGELLKSFIPSKHRIVVKQLQPLEGYLSVLKDLWRSGANHIMLDCSIDILGDVLREAQKVGLMTNQYHYIITNLDLHTLDLEPYQHGETNITGMIFVNPDDEELINVARQIYTDEELIGIEGWKLRLEEALTYDAIMMFAKAINELGFLKPIASMSCSNSKDIFSSGTSIINFMKALEYEGLTGKLQFDVTGFRTHFGLDITELKEGGLTTVGSWNSAMHPALNITRSSFAVDLQEDISNKTFIVITTLTEPYGMEKDSIQNLQGNDRYEGFGIDLIHEVSLMKGFNYTIIIDQEKKNGQYNETLKKWTGMLGEVIYGNADLAITDLTVTSEREEAVDFTSPFMTLGISILYKKPTKAPPGFFSFAQPFDVEVWKLLVVSCAGVSVILFILGRLSPTEWENPYPCIEEPEYLINQLDLRNSFWFMTGAILQQGSEIELKSISTRMVAGMWWFFTLLMVASYTANLAAFLTTEIPDPHFSNLEELVQNAEAKNIKYGAKSGGATETFFRDKARDNNNSAFAQAYEFMKKHEKEVMVSDNKIGVEKAASPDENYAFFMESSSIEYEIQRKCDLHMVNGLLDQKTYGIAMRKNSTYRNTLSTAILQLQNSGKIEELRRKWWEEKRGAGKCTTDDVADATPLDLKNVGGVFFVTIYGTILAIFLAMFETILSTAKKSARTNIPFWVALKEEIRFYFKFREMLKPVIYNDDPDETSSHKFQMEEKALPYGFAVKLPSIDTLDSNNSNSSKSKKSKKKQRAYNKEVGVNTC